MTNTEQWLKQHNIQAIECIFPDMTGIARGKLVPVHQYLNETIRIAEGNLLATVNGDYTEEVSLLVHPNDKDMLLRPDDSSLRLSPWANKPTAQIINDCVSQNGELHWLSSRNVLRGVLAKLADKGLKPVIAPEVEFYLTAISDDPNIPISAALGKSSSPASVSQPLGIDAYYEFEAFYNRLHEYCDVQNLNVGVVSQEMGSGQVEINFHHGDAITMADQVFTLKRTIRHVAQQFGFHATFMAKPMAQQPGSSMHIHQSLIDIDSGENVFVNDDGRHSDLFLSYIAGLQKYTPKLLSFYAPNVNSYRRFARYMSAPISMHWGIENRTIAFRVPDAERNATRVENRFAGMDCNPYLAIAASLASGLAGINNRLTASEPYEGNCSDQAIDIERSLENALAELTDMDDFGELIHPDFINAYRLTKLSELDAYNSEVSAWERKYLKLMV